MNAVSLLLLNYKDLDGLLTINYVFTFAANFYRRTPPQRRVFGLIYILYDACESGVNVV